MMMTITKRSHKHKVHHKLLMPGTEKKPKQGENSCSMPNPCKYCIVCSKHVAAAACTFEKRHTHFLNAIMHNQSDAVVHAQSTFSPLERRISPHVPRMNDPIPDGAWHGWRDVQWSEHDLSSKNMSAYAVSKTHSA